jgi:hypothetical protein
MGRNATTAFSGDISTWDSIPARQDIWGNTTGTPTVGTAADRKASCQWSHGISSVPAPPPASDQTQADNIASTKFYKALEGTMTAFQGGVFLGELKEALHMIRNPAQSLRRQISNYTDYLKRNRGKMMRKPKNNRLQWLSDSWLEYAYGWAPTLNDLDSASKYLDKRANQLVQELVPIYAVGFVESTQFVQASKVVGVTNIYTINRYSYRTHRVYAGAVSSRAAGSTLMSMDSLGLSPRSFVPTLWEVMPYSFMVDYFTNVGDVLSAWSNQNVGLAWGRSTLRRSTEVESGPVYPTPSGLLARLYEHFVFEGKTKARKTLVNRGPISSVPIPSLQFELPGFGTKWINLAALATARQELRFR